jgi:hypothetical protein
LRFDRPEVFLSFIEFEGRLTKVILSVRLSFIEFEGRLTKVILSVRLSFIELRFDRLNCFSSPTELFRVFMLRGLRLAVRVCWIILSASQSIL